MSPGSNEMRAAESAACGEADEKMHLLVVDDDEVDRIAIIRALRQWHCPLAIVEAATADDALVRFAAQPFDAVLLDYRLPDMDGLEVLRRMNSRRMGSTAILMLTGMDDDDLATQCIEAGAQDFLLKQEISPRRLMRAVIHARMRHRIETALIESHGHDVGDQMLRIVAQRLNGVTRDGDILCRLGGDEFAVLAFQIGNDDTIHQLAERLLAAAARPVEIGGAVLPVTVSIGIALCPDNTTDADELFKCADLAMYRAKRGGRNQAHYFSEDLQRQVMRRVQTERDLRHALERGEFEVFYQPQVNAETGAFCGAEALVRWHHPERGLLAPGEFLDIAEDTGLIEPIGAWVLETACADVVSGAFGDLPRHIAVNLSAQQLRDPGLAGKVRALLDALAAGGATLELEITESVLIADIAQSQSVLEEIAALGVEIAIDDFGTGYSSLSYLKQLPIDTLKVDKSFLAQVPEGERDTRLLRALIQMARSMGFRVVVEGVETEAQARLCREYGADAMQGYHYARPMPRQALQAALRA